MPVEYNMYMILEMLRWWYSTGWLQAMERIISWPRGLGRSFSVSLLLRTLLAPWRRIVSVGGRSLDDKMRNAADNLISRFIGFFVRIGVLIAAAISAVAAFVAATVIVIAWPIMPAAIVYFVFRGIAG
jgi:hypothetical protein